MSEAVSNARKLHDAVRAPRSLVVAGDEAQANYWERRLTVALGSRQFATFEPQNKGNFLGTLRAYREVLRGPLPNAASAEHIEQIVMLVGSGTRLSPFTQALANMKSAFPLPDPENFGKGRSIGELAIRASLPIVECLQAGGFNGVIVRWGDEVQVPGHVLSTHLGQCGNVDAVRFGWRTQPTDLLATQKEWLLADASGTVMRDIVRQPLRRLREEFRRARSHTQLSTYVNLGSLAASHDLLKIACQVFGEEIDDPDIALNWDPYFWVALQCENVEEWRAHLEDETAGGQHGLRSLVRMCPAFFDKVQRVKVLLERIKGRPIRVAVLDFGQPYWLDIGSHFALRRALDDVFSDNLEGKVVRALLGIPETIISGESVIVDSRVAPGATVKNSIILGATIADSTSSLERAIVLGGHYGLLRVGRGGTAIDSHCEKLEVHGPHGIAFRVVTPEVVVAGDESVSTITSDDESFTLKYSDSLGPINSQTYDATVLDNKVSFRVAAELMRAAGPSQLYSAAGSM